MSRNIDQFMWCAMVSGAFLLAACAGAAEDVAGEVHHLQEMRVEETAPSGVSGETLLHPVFMRPPSVLRLRMLPQGGMGAQADLSIRGSAFSGAGLSLAGIALRNPQTEHFHAELPLPGLLFTEVATITGLDQAIASTGHLAGSLELILAPAARRGFVELGVSENGWARQGIFVQESFTKDGTRFGAAIFGSRDSADRGLDWPDNSLDGWNGGFHLQAGAGNGQIDFIYGHQRKRFGARGFYGVSPTLQATEETTDDLALLTGRWGSGSERFVRASFVFRQFEDEYSLPEIDYLNKHRSTVTAAMLDGAVPLTNKLGMTWRTEIENEKIDSVSLGNHERRRAGLMLLPHFDILDGVRLSAGAHAIVFTDDSPLLLPLLGAEWEISPQHRAYVSWTETVRLPSYTELNYESPASLGNSGLERQRSREWEIGWRYDGTGMWDFSAAYFQRRTRDSVDWVKTDADSRWLAVDRGVVRTRGVELTGRARLTTNLKLQMEYGYVHKASEDDFYASRYILDYPRHLARAIIAWQPAQAWSVTLQNELRLQSPNRVRTSDDTYAETSLEVTYTPPVMPHAQVALGVNNLWNDHFQVYPGQESSGRRFWAAFRWMW